MEKEAKVFSEEEKVAREMEKEVMRIPQNPGVYWIEGEQAKVAERGGIDACTRIRAGRCSSELSPIPMVSGKATLEIPNAHSLNIFTNPEQEFYIQLSQTERFGIIKLTPKGTVRVVEELTIVPVTKEMVEERSTVEIFQKQMTPDGLYKIWPKQPLPPGEYAVVEFSEGKMNMQIWDFAVKAEVDRPHRICMKTSPPPPASCVRAITSVNI